MNIHTYNFACKIMAKITSHDWNARDLSEAIDKYITAHDDAIRRECADRTERLTEFAEEVVKWSEAYPASIFHEPTPEQVDAVCKALGFRIDCISAMILRVFTKPWGDKARAAILATEPAREGNTSKRQLLECSVCGNLEGAPYELGDECCMCGGTYIAAITEPAREES